MFKAHLPFPLYLRWIIGRYTIFKFMWGKCLLVDEYRTQILTNYAVIYIVEQCIFFIRISGSHVISSCLCAYTVIWREHNISEYTWNEVYLTHSLPHRNTMCYFLKTVSPNTIMFWIWKRGSMICLLAVQLYYKCKSCYFFRCH